MSFIKTIAHIRSEFPSKFGIPRQSGLVKNLRAFIVFEEEYRNSDSLRGLEQFSYIWLVWGFSEAEQEIWSPTVRPPRLGGNTRMGVFATRSPYRPNKIGLSSVKIEKIELHSPVGPVIYVLGADLLDGTPIYDIKPYLPYTDCHPDAVDDFTDKLKGSLLKVVMDDEWLKLLPDGKGEVLRELLANDPRPAYQQNADRVYGMEFNGVEVKFSVADDVLTVLEIRGVGKK